MLLRNELCVALNLPLMVGPLEPAKSLDRLGECLRDGKPRGSLDHRDDLVDLREVATRQEVESGHRLRVIDVAGPTPEHPDELAARVYMPLPRLVALARQ